MIDSSKQELNYKDTCLQKRYVVCDYIDEGSCGKIHKVKDLENENNQLVVKFVDDEKIL